MWDFASQEDREAYERRAVVHVQSKLVPIDPLPVSLGFKIREEIDQRSYIVGFLSGMIGSILGFVTGMIIAVLMWL